MNKLIVKKSSELSLKKTKNLLDVTRKILTPRNNIAVVDDSWMERLWAWVDEHFIDDLFPPRDKSGLTNLQELSLVDTDLTGLPKEIVNLTNLKHLQIDKKLTFTTEQKKWIEQFNIDIKYR